MDSREGARLVPKQQDDNPQAGHCAEMAGMGSDHARFCAGTALCWPDTGMFHITNGSVPGWIVMLDCVVPICTIVHGVYGCLGYTCVCVVLARFVPMWVTVRDGFVRIGDNNARLCAGMRCYNARLCAGRVAKMHRAVQE